MPNNAYCIMLLLFTKYREEKEILDIREILRSFKKVAHSAKKIVNYF